MVIHIILFIKNKLTNQYKYYSLVLLGVMAELYMIIHHPDLD